MFTSKDCLSWKENKIYIFPTVCFQQISSYSIRQAVEEEAYYKLEAFLKYIKYKYVCLSIGHNIQMLVLSSSHERKVLWNGLKRFNLKFSMYLLNILFSLWCAKHKK